MNGGVEGPRMRLRRRPRRRGREIARALSCVRPPRFLGRATFAPPGGCRRKRSGERVQCRLHPPLHLAITAAGGGEMIGVECVLGRACAVGRGGETELSVDAPATCDRRFKCGQARLQRLSSPPLPRLDRVEVAG